MIFFHKETVVHSRFREVSPYFQLNDVTLSCCLVYQCLKLNFSEVLQETRSGSGGFYV